MEDMLEFFQNILATDMWPPRWMCGIWSEFHGWLYIISDLTIWLAYFMIPVVIMWFLQKKPDLPFLPVFWLFVAFILLCGATHALDAIIFWWPAYRLSALLRLVTAVVSMFTVFALVRDIPKLLEVSTNADLGNENSELIRDLEEKDAQIAALRRKVQELNKKQ